MLSKKKVELTQEANTKRFDFSDGLNLARASSVGNDINDNRGKGNEENKCLLSWLVLLQICICHTLVNWRLKNHNI